MKLKTKIKNFEKIIQDLESTDIDLDLAVEKYQKALIEAKEIFNQLQNLDKKIKILQKQGQEIIQTEL